MTEITHLPGRNPPGFVVYKLDLSYACETTLLSRGACGPNRRYCVSLISFGEKRQRRYFRKSVGSKGIGTDLRCPVEGVAAEGERMGGLPYDLYLFSSIV
jgi:hypothetical protein